MNGVIAMTISRRTILMVLNGMRKAATHRALLIAKMMTDVKACKLKMLWL